MTIAGVLIAPMPTAWAEVPEAVVKSLGAPEMMATAFGQLDFVDSVPTAETAQRTFDLLDFTQALSAYNNSIRAASAMAIVKGFEGIEALPGDVVITRTRAGADRNRCPVCP